MVKQVRNLDFYRFSTFSPGALRALSDNSFQLWLDIWTTTFQELNVDKERILSDEFLNRELMGLFDGTQPVGFLLVHFPDLAQLAHARTQYFTSYPTDLLTSLTESKDEVMIISNMTINPEWRKSQTDLPISELLLGFAVLRLLESPVDRMLSYFRNDRNTHKIFYRHGGTPLRVAERAHNVEVDFGEITRQSAQLSPFKECADMTLLKWQQFANAGGVHERQHHLFTPNGKTDLDL